MHAWGPEFFESMASTWGKMICLDDSTSKKRRFDVACFLISTQIKETILIIRHIRVNGVMYTLKFTEEEQSNSIFSMRQEFMPSFNTDSEK